MKTYAWKVQQPPVLYGFLKTMWAWRWSNLLDFKTPMRNRKVRNTEACRWQKQDTHLNRRFSSARGQGPLANICCCWKPWVSELPQQTSINWKPEGWLPVHLLMKISRLHWVLNVILRSFLRWSVEPPTGDLISSCPPQTCMQRQG